MPEQKSLFKETLIYSVGSFGSKILSFLLVPLYTFFLTKKEIGEYDLFITLVTLFIPLVSLQISDSAYRWLVTENDNKNIQLQKKVITNSVFVFLLAFILFCLIFYTYVFYNNFNYSNYFIITLFFSSLLPLLQNLLRGQGKTKDFALNGIVITFLIVISNVVFIYFLKLKVEGILIANIIANTIGCFIIAIRIRLIQYVSLKLIDKKLIVEMLQYALPLIPNLMSFWLISSASKFIILKNLGVEANGIYAISTRFPTLLVVVNSVLILPIQDAFLKENSSLSFFKAILKKFIVLELALVLILSVGAPIYTKYFVKAEFYESWKYMPFLYFGIGLNTIGALLGLFYLKKKRTLRITTTTFIGSVCSLLACFLLIDRYELYGISFAFFIGYLIMFLLRYFDIQKNSDIDLGIDIKLIIGIVIVFCIIFIAIFELNFAYQILLFGLVCVLLLFYFKDLLMDKLKNYIK